MTEPTSVLPVPSPLPLARAGVGDPAVAADPGDPAATRYLRATRREPVDATPVWFMRQAGRALPEFRAIRAAATLVEITRDPATCAEVTLQPVRRLGVDAAILFADITTPFSGLGVPFEIKPGIGPVVEHPIRTAADVGALRPFEPEAAVGPLLEAIRLIRAASPVPLIGFAGAPFTLACYLIEGGPSREFLRTKAFMHAEPDAWSALMEALVAMTVRYLGAQVAAGAQAVQLFDSWVGGLGPRDYERSVGPWMGRLFEGLAPLGVPSTHFGVGTAGLLRLQAAAGGDVIGLDWRIALDEGWALVGDRAVQGNLDPALLLGPFESVAETARWILDLADERPGHVFNLGHGVLPETDPDDLRRLVDLVHAHRPRRSVR
jgi:uroporphyrinogen decarboxylase